MNMMKIEMMKRNIMMTKNLSALLLVFLSSGPAFSASTIVSDFELLIPSQFQQNLIAQKWKTLVSQQFNMNWQFPDQTVQSSEGIDVQLKGLNFSVNTQLQKPAVDNAKLELDLKSSNLQAVLNIDEISVDQTVDKTVNGITGHFHIQAQCNNVQLTLKKDQGLFEVIMAPAVGSTQIRTVVQDVNVSWNADSWDVGTLNCTGAQGFDDVVRAQVQAIASDSEKFITPQKDLLKQKVQDYLSSWQVDLSTAKQLVTSRSDIQTKFTIEDLKAEGDSGARLTGHVEITFLKSSSNAQTVLTLTAPMAMPSSSTTAQLHLPADFARAVAAQSFSANSWTQRYTSAQIPGFSSLMSSRFIQFFVWPELMEYPKSSTFIFDLYSTKDVKLTGSGMSYSVNAPLSAIMYAPQSNKYVSFMNFSIPLTTKMNISVSNSKATSSFSSSSVGLSASWAKGYNPSYSRFSSSTIQSKIYSAIEGQSYSFTLPSIPVADGISLLIDKALKSSDGSLLFQLKSAAQ
jgi:hypothetical protein